MAPRRSARLQNTVSNEKWEIWRTLSFTGHEQVEELSEAYTKSPKILSTVIKNLWIVPHFRPGMQISMDDHQLTPKSKKFADDILGAAKIQNIAIECNLFHQGWLESSKIKPKQVLIVQNTDNEPLRVIDFTRPLFYHVTHLMVEPEWTDVHMEYSLPKDPLAPFPKLTHLAIHIHVDTDCEEINDALLKILSSPNLSRLTVLVVCLHTAIPDYRCSSAHPTWKSLSWIFSTRGQKPRLLLLPYKKTMKDEWERITGRNPEKKTIWERAEEEKERQPCAEDFYEAEYEGEAEMPEASTSVWTDTNTGYAEEADIFKCEDEYGYEAEMAESSTSVCMNIGFNSSEAESDVEMSSPEVTDMGIGIKDDFDDYWERTLAGLPSEC